MASQGSYVVGRDCLTLCPVSRDCLIHIFSFLNVEDLFNVSSVCKDWLEAAQTPFLWRRMCLQRWGVSNIAVVDSEHVRDAWKRYCLRRIHLESKMKRGGSSDYTYKTLYTHTGRVVGLVYLQKNTPTTADPWSFRSIVCSASTDGTVRAWDVKDGVELWCSPVQSPVKSIVSDMEHGLVITSDSSGLIKSWQAETGQEMASYPTASPYCTLLPYTIDNSRFLSVGTSLGTVETLTGPVWSQRSSLVVCDDSFRVNLLLLSPDKRWIFAGTKDEYLDSSPKVFWAASLTNPSAEEEPLCKSLLKRPLEIRGCHAAVFMPNHPARLAIVRHLEGMPCNKALVVLDVGMKKSKSNKSEIQVKKLSSSSLMWMHHKEDYILMEATDSDTVVVADDKEIQVHFLNTNSFHTFRHRDVSSIAVDSFRMVVASHIYLKVFEWRIYKHDEEKKQTAHELYKLGGLFSYNRAFTHVACDYSSIVAAVECNNGKDELKAYSFTS